jgi:hypothetical protein
LLAAQAATVLVQPIARRHPYALVLGAAVAGGLLMLARPWRWISTPALLAGLLPQIMAEAMKHLASKPGSAASKDQENARRPHT